MLQCNILIYIWATIWQNQQNECVPSDVSDQPDAQAYLSLHWVHSHFVGFVMLRLDYEPSHEKSDRSIMQFEILQTHKHNPSKKLNVSLCLKLCLKWTAKALAGLRICTGSPEPSLFGGARWLSGRVSDSGARGPGFETYRRRVVSLSKTLYSPKVLVNYPGSDGSVPTWLENCWLGR